MSVERENAGANELVGKVAALADLVDYQPGAIVSRAIIEKPAGTVTAFSLDEGEGLSEHTAPFDAMVVVLDGELEVTLSGRPVRVQAGQMLIMPANEPHALRAPARAKMLLVMIR